MPLCKSVYSPVNFARKLFKPSKDFNSAIKKILVFFFLSDIISEVGFWPFWLMLPSLGPNC